MKEEELPGSQPTKKVKLDTTELQQLKKHSLVAVSYTHLDVYKRQEQSGIRLIPV